MSWLIILWSQGSIDMIKINNITQIKMFYNQGRFSVSIGTVDRLKISFDFYKAEELLKLPAIIKSAEKAGNDVVINLKDQQITEVRRGLIIKR